MRRGGMLADIPWGRTVFGALVVGFATSRDSPSRAVVVACVTFALLTFARMVGNVAYDRRPVATTSGTRPGGGAHVGGAPLGRWRPRGLFPDDPPEPTLTPTERRMVAALAVAIAASVIVFFVLMTIMGWPTMPIDAEQLRRGVIP